MKKLFTQSVFRFPVVLSLTAVLFFNVGFPQAHCEELSNEELANQIELIYRAPMPGAPSTTTGPQYSGTSLMKMLRRRWDNLGKSIQKRLVHFLEEPVTSGPGAPDSQQLIETDHFKVFYQTSGESAVPTVDNNNNSVPDYAENTAAYLEKAWEVLITDYGFKAPPAQNNEKVSCHLRKINHNGLTHAATNVTAWMEIHCDIGGYTTQNIGADNAARITIDQEGMTAGLLKACCAHEFFHCSQASYDWDEQNWWCEATAEWAGDAVFPESKFYTHNVTPRFQNPQVSLISKEGWYEYAASIWAFFLAENYGGHDIIKSIWEECQGTTTVIEATNSVIGDIEEAYAFFACYNYIREYTDGARYPQMKEVTLNNGGTISSVGLKAPQYLGTNYFSFPPSDERSEVTVKLDNSNTRGDVRFIAINGQNWNILPQKLSGSTASISLPSNDYPDKLVVVVVSYTNDSELSYTLTIE